MKKGTRGALLSANEVSPKAHFVGGGAPENDEHFIRRHLFLSVLAISLLFSAAGLISAEEPPPSETSLQYSDFSDGDFVEAIGVVKQGKGSRSVLELPGFYLGINWFLLDGPFPHGRVLAGAWVKLLGMLNHFDIPELNGPNIGQLSPGRYNVIHVEGFEVLSPESVDYGKPSVRVIKKAGKTE